MPRVDDDDSSIPKRSACSLRRVETSEEVRFDYRRRDGEDSRRLVEPHQLVTTGRRWYLVAWDQRRDDWRTFRLDRLRKPRLAGKRFRPREIPGGDAASFVATSLGSTPRHEEATLSISAAFTELEDVLRWVDHTTNPAGDRVVCGPDPRRGPRSARHVHRPHRAHRPRGGHRASRTRRHRQTTRRELLDGPLRLAAAASPRREAVEV